MSPCVKHVWYSDVSVYKSSLLEHSSLVHVSAHCHFYTTSAELNICNRSYDPQSLKYLLFGPIRKYLPTLHCTTKLTTYQAASFCWGWRKEEALHPKICCCCCCFLRNNTTQMSEVYFIRNIKMLIAKFTRFQTKLSNVSVGAQIWVCCFLALSNVFPYVVGRGWVGMRQRRRERDTEQKKTEKHPLFWMVEREGGSSQLSDGT